MIAIQIGSSYGDFFTFSPAIKFTSFFIDICLQMAWNSCRYALQSSDATVHGSCNFPKKQMVAVPACRTYSLHRLVDLHILGFAFRQFAIQANLETPSIRITDRNGRLLYDILPEQGGRHAVLSFDNIPQCMKDATIAVEDKNFYSNPGIDLGGILRALWIDLRGGETIAGGSTITQQVARNLLLKSE